LQTAGPTAAFHLWQRNRHVHDGQPVSGVRAIQISEPYAAKMSRRHNDSNILCLGGRFIGQDLAFEVVDTWLKEPFEGGRHQRRVDLIDSLVEESDKEDR